MAANPSTPHVMPAGLMDQRIARSSTCDGVIQPSVCRGRPLSSGDVIGQVIENVAFLVRWPTRDDIVLDEHVAHRSGEHLLPPSRTNRILSLTAQIGLG